MVINVLLDTLFFTLAREIKLQALPCAVYELHIITQVNDCS